MPYKIYLTRAAQKDIKKLKQQAALYKKYNILLEVLKDNPYQIPCEELAGDLKGFYSRRLNVPHRLVYEVYEDELAVKILSVWTHYGQ